MTKVLNLLPKYIFHVLYIYIYLSQVDLYNIMIKESNLECNVVTQMYSKYYTKGASISKKKHEPLSYEIN